MSLKILFIMCNPKDSKRLNLGREIREIKTNLRGTPNYRNITIIDAMEARFNDVVFSLNKHQPDIVHFSGHGDSDGIFLTGDYEQSEKLSQDLLLETINEFHKSTKLVLLNSCFSLSQANLVSKSINFTIGINYSIQDSAAIAFSAAFYRALSFDRSLENSFDQGIISYKFELERSKKTVGRSIDIATVKGDYSTPTLVSKNSHEPENQFFFPKKKQSATQRNNNVILDSADDEPQCLNCLGSGLDPFFNRETFTCDSCQGSGFARTQ